METIPHVVNPFARAMYSGPLPDDNDIHTLADLYDISDRSDMLLPTDYRENPFKHYDRGQYTSLPFRLSLGLHPEQADPEPDALRKTFDTYVNTIPTLRTGTLSDEQRIMRRHAEAEVARAILLYTANSTKTDAKTDKALEIVRSQGLLRHSRLSVLLNSVELVTAQF